MTISVLLKDLTPMQRDLIRYAVDAEPDMRVIAEAEALGSEAPAPDAVILGTAMAGDLDRVAPVLARWPHSLVVAIEPQARQAHSYELQPRQTALGEIDPSDLVRLIRRTAQHGARWS